MQESEDGKRGTRQKAKQTSPLHQTVNSEVVCFSWRASSRTKKRKGAEESKRLPNVTSFPFYPSPNFSVSPLLFILVILSHGIQPRSLPSLFFFRPFNIFSCKNCYIPLKKNLTIFKKEFFSQFSNSIEKDTNLEYLEFAR